MDDLLSLVIWLLVLVLLVVTIVLPIVALVVSIRTRIKLKQTISRLESQQPTTAGSSPSLLDHVQQLTVRVARLEASMAGRVPSPPTTVEEPGKPEPQPPAAAAPPITTPPTIPPQTFPPPAATSPTMPPPLTKPRVDAEKLESIIGRRWLGWAAIALILFATAFFLKYAFDNRWIGELGRVTIGVGLGITLTVLGFRYHKRGWRVFSQILTGGGIVLLYLSAYASFGFYHLAPQRAAFAYMTILIAEAAVLALLYNAPAIAVMALLGGFLVPVLLRSDRDQYRALFGYIFALDVATLAMLRHWVGLSSIAFGGTHLLFWLWYVDKYHPRKVGAVITFQIAVFLAFLFAHVASRWLKKQQIEFDDDLAAFVSNPFKFIPSFENFALLIINPFVFFATAYHLLNPNYHDWMGTLAVGMALIYAGSAKVLLARKATTHTELLLMIGVALAFITLAIPIQFKTNWITMAWAVEGLVILWAGIQIRSARLRAVAHGVFTLAVLKLVFWDTPYGRAPFMPVLNKYFLSSLFVTACLFAAALAYQRLSERKHISARTFQLVLLIVAIASLWLIMSVETLTFFSGRAARLKAPEDFHHQRWLGQMALSVLWSVYAAVLMAVGFIRRTAAVRWVALSLFALTVVKVMLVDIAVLSQLYRIIAFLVLGLLLLIVAWGYHKVFHSKESST